MMKKENGISKIKTNNLNKYITEYVEEFCKKHNIEFDYWVADLVGTIGVFGDYFFSFEDIRIDLEKNQEENNIFEWYDYSVEVGMNNETPISYYNWVKNGPTVSGKLFKYVISDLKKHFFKLEYKGDLGDVGNEIGIVIEKYIDYNKVGYGINAFINGIKHGVELSKSRDNVL